MIACLITAINWLIRINLWRSICFFGRISSLMILVRIELRDCDIFWNRFSIIVLMMILFNEWWQIRIRASCIRWLDLYWISRTIIDFFFDNRFLIMIIPLIIFNIWMLICSGYMIDLLMIGVLVKWILILFMLRIDLLAILAYFLIILWYYILILIWILTVW